MSSTENTKTAEAGAGENVAEPEDKQEQQGEESSESQVSVIDMSPSNGIADNFTTARISGVADRD